MGEEASAGPAASRGPATVVISQRVAGGRSRDYRRWQDEVTAAAAVFPGYLGTEATDLGQDEGDSTVIYRFDTVDNLNTWLTSETREILLRRGSELFDESASQQVLVGGSGDNMRFVTVVVSHTVRQEDEAEFLDWQRRLTEAEKRFPGFSGSELFRPVPGVKDDWTAVYRFATSAELERWLASTERAELLRQGERFQDFQLRKITNAFGSWFSFDAGGAESAGPPSWKTALSVLVGLYPTVVLLTLAISKLWKGAPLWASLLLGNILSVSLLTWVVMPVVTHALRFWLAPADAARQPRTDLLGLLASVAFLALAAFVFWLVTVQLGTPP